MKVERLILENFRGYKELTIIEISDLSVFVGKNDIGKSTILEAMDIFFNNTKATVKLEKGDLNKTADSDGETEIMIGVAFSGFPDDIVLDATVPTTLEDEYLLNRDGYFEVRKTFVAGKLDKTAAFAYHPSNDEFVNQLLTEKITALKKKVDNDSLDCENKTKSSLLRRTIRESYDELEFQDTLIPLDKDGSKPLWEQIQKYLPVYALFQSDRSNNDQDSEVQDPMKLAVQEILKDPSLQKMFTVIAEQVESKAKEIADLTLEKLHEMNPEVAQHLKPNMPNAEDLKWADVFKKIAISSDDGIPLNKRGSGVKRLVLLNFFRAEAERRRDERNVASVIYAIEEPETSQHPEHQKMLITALIELSLAENTQILLTTHSPSLAQLLPAESVTLIETGKGGKLVASCGDRILLKIVDTLGAMPLLKKIIVCVEGEYDIKFLQGLNYAIPELREIVDLEEISIVPMQGSNLQKWIERDYLRNSNVIEFHLYDRDQDDKYKQAVERVEARPDQSRGFLTNKREAENYIHKELIGNFPVFAMVDLDAIQDWDNEDIPLFLSARTTLDESNVKEILNGALARQMTKELLIDLQAWEEVSDWFTQVKQLHNHLVP